LGEEFFGRSDVAGNVVSVALGDEFLDRGILEFQIIFKLVCVHEADDRNTVLLKNKVLMVEVGAFGQLAKVDACLGDRDVIN
jgi:hypothetical protein